MYNSIIVSILVKIWNILSRAYEYSLLKKFNDSILKGFKNLSKSSHMARLFISNRSLVRESSLYALYCHIVDRISKIFTFLREKIEENNHGSIIYSVIYNLFHDNVGLQTTFYVFFISFGVGIALNNLIRGFYAGKSYIISFLLVLISFIGLGVKENYKNVLRGSYIYAFIKSLFTIDEGVDQWW